MYLEVKNDSKDSRPILSVKKGSSKRLASRRDVATPTLTDLEWKAVDRFLRTTHGKAILEEFAARGMELERKRLRRHMESAF